MGENAIREENDMAKDENQMNTSDRDMQAADAEQAETEQVREKGQEETQSQEDEVQSSEEEEQSQEDEVQSSEDENQSSEETEDGKEKKKVFGKSKRKDKKDEAMKEKVAELEDKVMRQMAEFENFRRRTEKEKGAMFETGARSVIEKILPVVDNFERGLAAIPEEEKGNPFADGMNMIYKQLMTELENIGVRPIEAVGCEFDPKYHNAVMQVESDELESGMVAQELQKGYMYHDTVVRHSMVGVTA